MSGPDDLHLFFYNLKKFGLLKNASPICSLLGKEEQAAMNSANQYYEIIYEKFVFINKGEFLKSRFRKLSLRVIRREDYKNEIILAVWKTVKDHRPKRLVTPANAGVQGFLCKPR